MTAGRSGPRLGQADAVTLRERVRAGELSASDVALAVTEGVGEDAYRAWATFDGDRLLAQARALDDLAPDARQRLALFGVPVAIKDAFDTRDLPTSYGSPAYANHQPTRDAGAVARLRSAGALIAGKTKCTELSWMTATDTLNPLDEARTPGGSSSGSAAAVAACQVPLATGTQTAGSTIRPASYCAILGFKPTFGAVPRDGVMPLSPTLDTVGVFARSVADLLLVTSVLSGAEPSRTTLASKPAPPFRDGSGTPRIGFARTVYWDRLEPDAREAIELAVERIRTAGLEIADVDLGAPLAALTDAQRTIQYVESAASLAPLAQSRPDLLSEQLREAIGEGAAIDPQRYEGARATARELADDIRSLLADFDGVLAPSAHGVPPLGLEFTGDPLFCRAFTLVGVPCLALPIAWTPDGLPVGLQLVGGSGRDLPLLQAAGWLLDCVGAGR